MNELILRNMSEESKKNMTSLKHTGIELTSGVVAGIAAATLSQVRPPPLRLLTTARGHTSISNQQRQGWRRRSGVSSVYIGQSSRVSRPICGIRTKNAHDCTAP